MYIKQVIIEGFKSYREQVATEAFSPKVNCVVGANGSGKTNFFHAIRFVLSDLFQNLRSEDRHALLHEGAGHQVLSAFVEIVFDNADNRIPVDKEEVRLRRTIGLKKDEYFLDGKHITKTEVMNLLESAGFSRSNPYYVVQQGKIASLTLMKDSERLDLLKEIGGTRVYEERRRESLKIMQETGNKIKQIVQVVQYLDERLKELDEEKEELRQYQQFDKQRKSLEYTIYDKELQDARQKLAEVEDARNKVSETSTKMYNTVLDAHEKSKELDKILKDLTKELQTLDKEKEAIEKRRTEAIKKRTELQLDVNDLEEKKTGIFQFHPRKQTYKKPENLSSHFHIRKEKDINMAEKTNQAYPLAPANGYTRSDAESLQSADELKRKKRTKLAIYIGIFIVFQILVITALSLTVMKVKTPKVRLGNINIQNFNSAPATPSFDTTFTTQIKVKNTNFGPYKYDAAIVTFLHQGATVGQVSIPKSKAGMLSTKKIDVEVSLSSSALSGTNLGSELNSGVLTLNSAAKLTGKVELMLIMKKKKSSTMDCTMAFDLSSKTLKSLKCK